MKKGTSLKGRVTLGYGGSYSVSELNARVAEAERSLGLKLKGKAKPVIDAAEVYRKINSRSAR